MRELRVQEDFLVSSHEKKAAHRQGVTMTDRFCEQAEQNEGLVTKGRCYIEELY